MRVLTIGLFTALLSAPAFAADLGTYRPGTPYNSVVAPGADVCDSQCAGDAQCRGWNYVKPNPRAAGICEFLSSTSAPISSQISISGENETASSFSSRVATGGTNTVRVGTRATPRSTNTVTVGQSPSGRRVVRHAPTQNIRPQQASTKPIENMSLTEQQNRYRNAQNQQPSPQINPAQINQRRNPQPVFRPILDGAAPNRARPTYATQRQSPQSGQGGNAQGQLIQRRSTGPRNAPTAQQAIAPQPRSAPVGQQYSRSPVGQPIYAPSAPQRPKRLTPSQRLAQFTAQTQNGGQSTPPTGRIAAPKPEGPVALNADQARQSLFGRLNDDVKLQQAAPQDMPVVTAVPTRPVSQEPLSAASEDQLAGGR